MQRPIGNLKLQLDRMVQDAEQVVVKSNNQEALYLLNQAKRFQNLAYDSFRNNQPVKSRDYYRIAYFFANKCTDLALNRNRDIDSRLSEVENTIQNLFTQAESFTSDTDNAASQKLLEESRIYYQDALKLIDEGKKELALRRLILIERLLYRMYDQSERKGIDTGMQLATRLYSQQTLLQSLESELPQKDNKILKKAQDLYGEAQQAYTDNRYGEAAQKLALSQRLANTLFRSLRQQEQFTDARISSRLNDTRRLLNMQDHSKNGGHAQMSREAHALLDRAEEEISRGNDAAAFPLIQAATRLAHRLQRMSQGEDTRISDREILEQKQNRFEVAIASFQSNSELVGKYGNIINQWQYFADQSRKSLESGNFNLAEEYINTGLEQIKRYSIKWHESSE
jgi:hypothetical protein